MPTDCELHPVTAPGWLPDTVAVYLAHTEAGHSIRELARRKGCHASTVLRRVRRTEQRRDDPLFDEALTQLGTALFATPNAPPTKETSPMTAPIRSETLPDETRIEREGRRILRRLCETGAVLAVSKGLDKAVVLRMKANEPPTRTAVVDREIAQVFAVKDWVEKRHGGKVDTYEISAAGRSALKRMLAEDHDRRARDLSGFSEDQTAFSAQHRDWGEKKVRDAGGGAPRRMRYNLAESPLSALARRIDSKTGEPFLSPDLVHAGERLREDFELAQMGPRVAQNWDRFLTGGDRGGFGPGGAGGGSDAARARVGDALHALGPGLGDILLRCCCFLEGLEAAERRMGWSARSGKIVLRIALQQLLAHYERVDDGAPPLIG
ncbi:MAG: DUF6456 domain-containing protein [Brevirhabdus sp.]